MRNRIATLNDVDPKSPHLTKLERETLTAMLAKREKYVFQGRAREAHGAGTAILIFWQHIVGDRSAIDTMGADL